MLAMPHLDLRLAHLPLGAGAGHHAAYGAGAGPHRGLPYAGAPERSRTEVNQELQTIILVFVLFVCFLKTVLFPERLLLFKRQVKNSNVGDFFPTHLTVQSMGLPHP